MKVSIITISYNSATTIRDTIDSVLNQTYPHIEYIVVDGNSSDGTREIVKSYGSRISKFISEPDKGIYDAMNKGVEMTTGQIVGILNSDDMYYHDNVIEKVVACFEDPGVSAVYGDLIYVKPSDLSHTVRYWKAGKNLPYKTYHSFWQPPHPTLFLHTELYNQFGKFNLAYKIGADVELMARLFIKNKIPGTYLPEILVKMRAGGESNKNMNSRKTLVKEYYRILKEQDIKLAFYAIPMRLINKILQYFKANPVVKS